MQTSIVFDFLSAQNLLVPFLKQEKVLQDLEKEELLVLVEKLLDPPTQEKPVEKTIDEQMVEALSSITFQTEEKPKFSVDTHYRQNTIKMTIQDVLSTLVKDGVVPYGGMSKNEINKIAYNLGLIDYKLLGRVKLWQPTEEGKKIGVIPKSNCAVYYSLEAYDEIKSHLLSKF